MGSLTTLVNETTQIKTDLISTRDTFKTKMTSKGFDTSSVNKISDLVNLTDNLSNTRWESGDNTTFKEKGNSSNYDCNTEYKLLYSMDMSNIDLMNIKVESLKVNTNFQQNSTGGISYSFYVKTDIVNKNGTVIYTKTGNGYQSSGSSVVDIINTDIDIPSIEEGYTINVYGKVSKNSYQIRLNNVKISASLKADNNIISLGKKFAMGRTLTTREIGGIDGEVLEIHNLNFTPSIVLAWNKESTGSNYQSSSILYYYNKLSANAITDTLVSSGFTYVTNYNDSNAFSPGNRIGTVYIDKVYKTGSYVFDGKARLVTNQFYQQRYLDWIAFE